jgi:ribosomal protein S18 acetylase RimI-like enzyme
MPQVFNELHGAYVQEYGARSSWRRMASADEAVALLRKPYVEAVEQEPEGFSAAHALEFDDAPLRAASRAYKRECGWDFPPSAPSSDYVWLCVHQPLMCFPEDDAIEVQFTGSLIGFVIVADRDEDGAPESLAHVWVARQARRRGNAALLLAEARSRFPQLNAVEEPVTADGLRLLCARWPELAACLPVD